MEINDQRVDVTITIKQYLRSGTEFVMPSYCSSKSHDHIHDENQNIGHPNQWVVVLTKIQGPVYAFEFVLGQILATSFIFEIIENTNLQLVWKQNEKWLKIMQSIKKA